MGKIETVRAKLHGIKVTGTDLNLNYYESITLDPLHCKAVGIYPLGFVCIWNRQSRCRTLMYVIYGEPGSQCCVLNGTAARTCQVGDEVVIAARDYIDPSELTKTSPRVMTFKNQNKVDWLLTSGVMDDEYGWFGFSLINDDST